MWVSCICLLQQFGLRQGAKSQVAAMASIETTFALVSDGKRQVVPADWLKEYDGDMYFHNVLCGLG